MEGRENGKEKGREKGENCVESGYTVRKLKMEGREARGIREMK